MIVLAFFKRISGCSVEDGLGGELKETSNGTERGSKSESPARTAYWIAVIRKTGRGAALGEKSGI